MVLKLRGSYPGKKIDYNTTYTMILIRNSGPLAILDKNPVSRQCRIRRTDHDNYVQNVKRRTMFEQ